MNVKELISAMQNGAYDSNLKAVYLTDGAFAVIIPTITTAKFWRRQSILTQSLL